jgi:hypothetical protein
MPSSAVQLPSHRGGRCRHRGAVMGCRAPQMLQPERGLRRPAGGRRRSWPSRMSGRRPRRSSLCPRPLSAVRTDVRPTGRADVRCPRIRCPGDRVQATGVHTTGAIRVSGRTPVRCPRPLHPSCPHRAGSRIRRCGGTGHVWRTGFDVPPWSASGLVVAAWIGPGGKDGRTRAMRGSHECRRQTWAAAWYACRLRRRARRLAEQGS